ncbi:response regulator transcription factor [Vibrio cincinnatiensis]|uniref:response regulator transcription factor n=1 Tax=Vibrio cincinnatiensis TaxID=675 RepID=UPI0012ACC04B|nr:response regulator transcription factor [Vibrio cincinnatiensis]
MTEQELKKDLTCLIIDDHALVCVAIKQLLEKENYFSNIIIKQNPTDGIKYIRNFDVDFLILDVNFFDYDGFDLLRRIKFHGYQGKTLIVSGNDTKIYSDTAFRVGAEGYVSKSEDLSTLVDAVETILNGYTYFKSEVDRKSPVVTLSKQELAVFRFLVDGKTNKEISTILSLSPKTISTYKTRILEKYKVKSIIELMNLRDSVL